MVAGEEALRGAQADLEVIGEVAGRQRELAGAASQGFERGRGCRPARHQSDVVQREEDGVDVRLTRTPEAEVAERMVAAGGVDEPPEVVDLADDAPVHAAMEAHLRGHVRPWRSALRVSTLARAPRGPTTCRQIRCPGSWTTGAGG
ncbi:MAG TPA: hypothetical protein PKW35_18370 [Nannocystaceae bacterium]|nr:hypothetical protein [Nannocystaceae bacterium]